MLLSYCWLHATSALEPSFGILYIDILPPTTTTTTTAYMAKQSNNSVCIRNVLVGAMTQGVVEDEASVDINHDNSSSKNNNNNRRGQWSS